MVNSGDIDAYIGGLSVFTLNCENETGDRNIVCNNLEWSLKYKETGNTSNVAVNDTLKSGQTRHMIYEIGYKESAETLPEDDVTFNDLQITITYNQDMGVSQDSSGGDISSDTDTYYNIKFNDLSSLTKQDMINTFGSVSSSVEGGTMYLLLLSNSDSSIIYSIAVQNYDSEGFYITFKSFNDENIDYSYNVGNNNDSSKNNKWFLDGSEADTPLINENVKILSKNETNSVVGSNIDDFGGVLLNDSQIDLLLNITPVS